MTLSTDSIHYTQREIEREREGETEVFSSVIMKVSTTNPRLMV